MLLFLIAFIDRTNIANAKIEGMIIELHMGPTDYNKALWILIIPCIILALPSNLLMKQGFVRPGTYLSGLIFCWSLCTIGLGVTRSYKGVLVCRFLMGCLEAGFVPGCAYLIGRYYRRHDFSVRYALFFSASVLASAFGGLLAFAIRNMDGVGGYSGWRWIFIIEGLMTTITAVAGYFIIPTYPADSTFLTLDEKTYLLQMFAVDAGAYRPNHFDYSLIKECISDPKIWLGTIAYFGFDNAASSIVGFQPTILLSLGYSRASAPIHTIPVYIVALVLLLICSYLSGLLKHRYLFIVFGAALGIIGWTFELAVPLSSTKARYFGMFAITASANLSMPMLVVWVSNNMEGNAKAVFATGFMIGLGNCGNLVSSNVFITLQNPRYRTGSETGLALTFVSLLAASCLEAWLWFENRRWAGGKKDRGVKDMGSYDPEFRYIL